MDGLVIGIDLCNEYTQISCAENEKTWTIPTVICKCKHADEWYVGEEAYAHALVGDGVIVDKLVKLVQKEGTATLCNVRYRGADLMKQFIRQILVFPEQELGNLNIRQLVFTVRKIDFKLLEALEACATELQIPRERMHVISHTEAWVYYILSQKKEIWNNLVGMFDLSEERLRYYEMKVQRGLKKTTVVAEFEDLEEGFNLDILTTPAGAKLGDKILCSCGERLMQKKLYSAMFLTGKGFDNREWAEEFMKLICSKRRVYMEPHIFAKGAAYKAADYMHETTSYPYTCICEGRLKTTVSLNVMHKGQETSVVIASAGDNWYEMSRGLDVITDHQNTVDFVLSAPDGKSRKLISIPLEGFPKRPERTSRVRIQISFLDEKTMDVSLKDMGFGELFPATNASIRQEVML